MDIMQQWASDLGENNLNVLLYYSIMYFLYSIIVMLPATPLSLNAPVFTIISLLSFFHHPLLDISTDLGKGGIVPLTLGNTVITNQNNI